MFCTHIFFNGNCREAIELYKAALHADVLTVLPNPAKGKENEVIHAEIQIHGQKLMLNDFGNNEGTTRGSGYQLVVQFETIAQLEESYNALLENSIIVSPRQPTDYSPCVVQFIDKFGIQWGFFV